jgi:hypothetical protein
MAKLTLLLPLFVSACTGEQDSTVAYCGQDCADYYTVRAVEDVTSRVWTNMLSPEKPPLKDFPIPCVDGGSITASGTWGDESDGSVTVDVTLVHDDCKEPAPTQAGGYDVTLDGIVAWAGTYSEDAQERDFTYQSPELSVEGTVYEQGVPTAVDETCVLQATLTAANTQDFSFSGAWCGRDIVNP